MVRIIKNFLLILTIINVIAILFLVNLKKKFIIKNPVFGTVINSIIKDEKFCEKFNIKTNNIFDYSGKSVIFNIYSLDNLDYKDNMDLVDDIINDKLNVNIIDVISYGEKNSEKIKEFITKYNINRPVLYVKDTLLERKLSIKSNSVIVSDFDINNVVKLANVNYDELEENIKNLYKKTKKIQNRKTIKTTKINNDELLIKSIGNMLSVKNADLNELFFVDYIGKKIFSIYANGRLNYYIGNGKEDDGIVENTLFNDIKSIKFYKNCIYILDGNFIKKLDLETNRIKIILQDNVLDDVIDFEVINENNFVFSTKNSEIIVYNDDFKTIKSNFVLISKIVKYGRKIILLDAKNSKLYTYKNKSIQEFIYVGKFLNQNAKIIDLAVSDDAIYLLADNNTLLILKNDKIHTKTFQKIDKIKNIALNKDILYISNNSDIYELSIKGLNNDNYENKIKKLDFQFSYKSKNYFGFEEFDFKNADRDVVWKNSLLSFTMDNKYIDYKAPNYITLYEVNDNKISYISKNSMINDGIVFNEIDTNKRYYVNGKIYYRYKNEIFVKKINKFIDFRDNCVNKSIEINFNNIYLNS